MPLAARLLVVVAASAVTLGPPAAAAPATPVAGAQAVMIMDYRYQPGSLTVGVGDTVTWTNHDRAAHDVSGTGLQSPELGEGASWAHTFSQPGAFPYICSLHPEMTGTVNVSAPATTAAPTTPAPSPAPVEAAPTPTAGAAPSATTLPTTISTTPTTAPTPPTVPSGDQAATPAAAGSPAATHLPPLAVAAAVVAVVLASTFALLGGTRPPVPSGETDDDDTHTD